ncbi:unnamed protein product, partial [marine sediment metagenome]
ENLRDIPVYYMTCMRDDKVKERMEDTKADGYILKPFEYDDIAKLIDEYIQNVICCQYCGMELTKEEQLTHSCRKTPYKLHLYSQNNWSKVV